MKRKKDIVIEFPPGKPWGQLSLKLQCHEVRLKLEGWRHDWATVDSLAADLTKRWKEIVKDVAAVEVRLSKMGKKTK